MIQHCDGNIVPHKLNSERIPFALYYFFFCKICTANRIPRTLYVQVNMKICQICRLVFFHKKKRSTYFFLVLLVSLLTNTTHFSRAYTSYHMYAHIYISVCM